MKISRYKLPLNLKVRRDDPSFSNVGGDVQLGIFLYTIAIDRHFLSVAESYLGQQRAVQHRAKREIKFNRSIAIAIGLYYYYHIYTHVNSYSSHWAILRCCSCCWRNNKFLKFIYFF